MSLAQESLTQDDQMRASVGRTGPSRLYVGGTAPGRSRVGSVHSSPVQYVSGSIGAGKQSWSSFILSPAGASFFGHPVCQTAGHVRQLNLWLPVGWERAPSGHVCYFMQEHMLQCTETQ